MALRGREMLQIPGLHKITVPVRGFFSVDKYPKKTTGNVIHMVLPVELYYPQNKKIIFSVFHNGFFGGVNSNTAEILSKIFLDFCTLNR